jgi:hypothetical protein
MSSATHVFARRLLVLFITLTACFSLFGQPASAQHWRHHRHRVVTVRRVWRHGHWVTIRRVVYR